MTIKSFFIGRNGYVSSYLRMKSIPNSYFSSSKLGSDKLHLELNNFKPEYLIILGGIINFIEIKKSLDKAIKVNVLDTIKTLEICKLNNIIPIFISSESVFDGETGFYCENSKPNPIFHYGEMKNQVEKYIQKNFKNYSIIRFSKVYSINNQDNTLLWSLIKQADYGDTNMKLSSDSLFSPVSIEYIYEAFKKIVKSQNLPHFLHLSGIEFYSREGLADLYNSLINGKLHKLRFTICKHHEIPEVAYQPKKTNLISDKTRSFLKIKPDKLSDNLQKIIQKKILFN